MTGLEAIWNRRIVCLAALAVLLVTFDRERGRVRASAHAEWSEATWVAAPVVQVDIAADPHVTTPAAEIGDCDVHERFLVQAVVTPGRAHIVALSHFGGLYGP